MKPLCTIGGNGIWFKYYGKQYEVSSKKLNAGLTVAQCVKDLAAAAQFSAEAQVQSLAQCSRLRISNDHGHGIGQSCSLDLIPGP